MSDNRPLDFGQFWYSLGKELSEVPIAAETETLTMRSTDLQIYTGFIFPA